MSTTVMQVCDLCHYPAAVSPFQVFHLCAVCLVKMQELEGRGKPTRLVEPEKCAGCGGTDANCPYCRGGRGIL